MITAAIAAEYPRTLTELARDAGISKFAASRAAEGLTGSGLLSHTVDGYAFNDEHPLAPVLLELAWTFSGTRRPTYRGPTYRAWGAEAAALEVDVRHRRWVPESLIVPAALPDPATDGRAGPTLQDVRRTIAWMDGAVRRLRDYRALGQDVYGWWGNERLRDVVHQTLQFGGALSPARHRLIRAAGQEAQGAGTPESVSIPALVWVQATHLASAELREMLRVISLLDTAIRVGGTVNRWQSDAVHHLHTVNAAGRSSEFSDRWIQEALDAARRARELWTDESYGHYKQVGGTPGVVDVGTAGDMILAVALHRDATELAARVKEMAAHPSVEQWCAEYPDEAERFPVVVDVPAGVLHDSRTLDQMPAPEPGAGPHP